ncbi:uncharacterized protein LOC110445535 [Mizuhopecten yessoensis]|uniref:EF-hand domain-containing protein n=1 Tax=Mizuhopecten yessoensis TaxID=6573 RepID=A0A210QZ15_MIZYE|nr:uncharacterized protein LOC110445535 [Mizuhopecten yessoensis]OWF53974.1 hypothetical protein KP79_PYT15343 [Mizuhopecten yessoensis]
MFRLAALFAFLCMVSGNTPAYETLFERYDNAQGAMSKPEFHNFWLMSFDSNHDSRITAKEFRDHWISNRLPHTDHALLFFIEMDVNHDTVIDITDLDKLYPLFDKNEDGFIENDEFYAVWDALFEDVLDLHSS